MLFKFGIVASLAILPFAMGNGYEESSGYGHGQEAASYGKHDSYEPHYPPQPYKFGYDVKDGYGGNLNQKEEGDSYGNKKGSYGYTDAYGIYRHVEYIADKNGFRASIKTNEPGTASQNPADVYMNANPAPAHYEAPATYKGDYKAASQPKVMYKAAPAGYAQAPKAEYPSAAYSSLPIYAEY